jgi:hypothetical protein
VRVSSGSKIARRQEKFCLAMEKPIGGQTCPRRHIMMHNFIPAVTTGKMCIAMPTHRCRYPNIASAHVITQTFFFAFGGKMLACCHVRSISGR